MTVCMGQGSQMARRSAAESRQKILNAIQEYTDKHGMPPVVREIAEMTDLNDGYVSHHLRQLRLLGYVDWQDNTQRTCVVLRPTYED